MSERKYEEAVFIGRFQPFHDGHLHVITEALKIADNITLIIGSTDQPATSKNPMSFQQRVKLIEAGLPTEFMSRVFCEAQVDYPYNEGLWISQIVEGVSYRTIAKNICLVGYEKDDSSYYIKKFPMWPLEVIPAVRELDATKIRSQLYQIMRTQSEHNKEIIWGKMALDMPSGTLFHLRRMLRESSVSISKSRWEQALTAYEYDLKYKLSWEKAPFAPVFVTGDAVCVSGDKVLLIKRGQEPGEGLWAIPGGFIDQGETIRECIIRELMEETKIKVPKKVLNGSMRTVATFDSPNRSSRGRCITHAGLIVLDDEEALPKVKAADDAAEAWWHPISSISRRRMFEDHYHILSDMLKLN